jgi:ABC-2 type transport system ATP-binding protein
VDDGRRSFVMPVSGGPEVLSEALRRLDERQVRLEDVGLRRPTLDDVFLALTGKTAEQDGNPDPKAGA